MMMIKLSFVTVAVAILNLFGDEGGNKNPSLANAILTEEQLEQQDIANAKAAEPEVEEVQQVQEISADDNVKQEVEEVQQVQEISADDNVEQDEQPSAVAEEVTAASVSCGSHTASTCGKCLDDAIANEAILNKEGFCNGVCVYNHETKACVASDERVDCGHHQAASCEECTTEDEGARYCHGKCKWSAENKCEAI